MSKNILINIIFEYCNGINIHDSSSNFPVVFYDLPDNKIEEVTDYIGYESSEVSKRIFDEDTSEEILEDDDLLKYLYRIKLTELLNSLPYKWDPLEWEPVNDSVNHKVLEEVTINDVKYLYASSVSYTTDNKYYHFNEKE